MVSAAQGPGTRRGHSAPPPPQGDSSLHQRGLQVLGVPQLRPGGCSEPRPPSPSWPPSGVHKARCSALAWRRWRPAFAFAFAPPPEL